jgi:hypothetical protein
MYKAKQTQKYYNPETDIPLSIILYRRNRRSAKELGGSKIISFNTGAPVLGKYRRVGQLTIHLPKNASKAVLFLEEPRPSSPFMKIWLSFRGLGRFWPASMYTPSA